MSHNDLSRQMYENMLQTEYQNRASARRNEHPTVAGPSGSYMYHNNSMNSAAVGSPASTGSSTLSRKRSLGPADYPEPKRTSNVPSPLTPGTPNSIHVNTPLVARDMGGSENRWASYAAQQPSLPSRPQQATYPHTVVDLTISDPPTPDPFPELVDAYQPYGNTLTNVFDQDWMPLDEFAQFLMTPSPNDFGYGFHQQGSRISTPAMQLNSQANIPAYTVRNVPYLPSFQGPGGDSDSEDYGDFPMTVDDARSIDTLLENIQNHGDDEDPQRREQTPRIMSSTLKEYQKIGLGWLLKMESGNTKGGILADEMGLGKTVQALSLICANPSKDPLRKTTLIIAPVGLMRQWEKEIERHVRPEHRLSVYLYHGKGKNAEFSKLKQYDVVLTTFGILTSEWKQKESMKEKMAAEAEQRDNGFTRRSKEKLALLGRECMWYRIIIDEAHNIKNRNAKASKAANELMATHRLCMTGTPLMNSAEELYSLLRFLKTPGYTDWYKFNREIAKPMKSNQHATRVKAMQRVQIIVKSVMLRRQKTTKVDGQVICTIPPKHTTVDNVVFSEDESELYKALQTKSQVQLNKYLEAGTMSHNYAAVLVLLLRLRQACCHPHLIKDLSQPATEGIAEVDLLSRAGELREDVVVRLKDSESFECPVCLEADPNPTIIIPCGHTVCGECVQKLIDTARSNNEDGRNAKCPHCRGELQPKVITDYKHFCKVFCPEKLSVDDLMDDADLDAGGDSDVEDEDEDDEDDDDADEHGNLADFVVPDDADGESGFVDADDAVPAPKRKTKARGKGKGKGKAPAKPKMTLAQLKKESLRNKAAKKKYLRRLQKTWVPSAKTEKTLELLDQINRNDPTEKTLIFSQFTSFLDLLEVPLAQKKIHYQRYDGSMNMDERAEAVNQFMDNPNENVMLVSIKAGNSGLNLWKASQVILLDPFWNPYIEEQAVDRAHRMPQPREVTVHRILVPETVEDRICELQETKRELVGNALDENASKSLARLDVRQLKHLFGMG
ncbi:hypothetical protein P153DRAFT_376928 [Dothidotthia symphoricarpi CBS 119687]|uniref:SWI/SNF family DNA-dependent ATPase Ris1 n=1 Tax=Dothidotthia symphoricarpi CBS 119687 TaxID=1392245 RepID=A0A6A6ABF2_9PLEO|nr:uncharacterized protein P153DRAFT_376928 [Dothidotthia symphoricarpi CBS 119687]KAF2128031.1 hypothetical protein P153DRAFT_376928 [Dothidotthia symphoricarpi CBS 119687]